jgi:hypothetical protein
LHGRSPWYGLAEGDTVFKISLIQPLVALSGKFSNMCHHCRAAECRQAEPQEREEEISDRGLSVQYLP